MEHLAFLDDKCGIQGTITFTNFLIEHPRAQQIDQFLGSARGVSRETYQALIDELLGLCGSRGMVVRNKIVLSARSEMAKRLVGTQAYTGTINYGALGTSSTAVADSQTQLVAEVARALVATATQTNDTAAIDFYYSKASTNGTYQEFALSIDGTASANTGLMFNRALTGGWTKTSLEAMTVSAQINITSA